jgi:hypothetical protein
MSGVRIPEAYRNLVRRAQGGLLDDRASGTPPAVDLAGRRSRHRVLVARWPQER